MKHWNGFLALNEVFNSYKELVIRSTQVQSKLLQKGLQHPNYSSSCISFKGASLEG